MLAQMVQEQRKITLSEETISYVSLFGALDREQLERLLGYMTQRHCRSGERIFSRGDLPSDIYVLLQGRVDFVVEEHGVARLKTSYKVGDTFGETAVIGIQTQIGSAIASGDDVELLVLSRDSLLLLHKEDPYLYGVLMMNIAREVSRKLHASVL